MAASRALAGVIHAGVELAVRLEGLICEEWRRIAAAARSLYPGDASQCMEVGGGVALWLGNGSPLNSATGLGMLRAVGESDLVCVEDFYRARGAHATIGLCPFADPSLLVGLGDRKWRATEFEHVLYLELDLPLPDPDPAIEVRVCQGEERAVWAELVPVGFAREGTPAPGHQRFSRVAASQEDAVLFLAWVDGVPAGTGKLVIADKVGWLSADTTLPEFGGRGVQRAVQLHRLRAAQEAGCELAVTESSLGSGSQRNMERLGFRIAYTHVEFAGPDDESSAQTATGG